MFRADPVNAAKSLNQSDRIPMEIIVNDLVAVLKIETFGEDVGGNDHHQFFLSSGEAVFRVCLGSEATNDPNFALVSAKNHINILPRALWIQIFKEVSCCIRVLGKDQPLAVPQRLFCKFFYQRLEFGVLIRCDGLDKFQHLFQQPDIVGDVLLQSGQVKIGYIVLAGDVPQGIHQILLFVLIRFIKDGLGILPGGDEPLRKGFQESLMDGQQTAHRFLEGINAR